MQTNPPASYSAKVANVVFLKDDAGKVQVIVPGNRIVDLNRLSQRFERQFTALSRKELEQFKAQQRTDQAHLPILPKIETLVDEELFDQPELYMLSGHPQQWVKVPIEQFRSLTHTSKSAHISAEIHPELHDTTQDLHKVHAALLQFTPLRIRQRLSETLDLPPLPETAQRVIDLRLNPNVHTAEFVEAVELDPVLAAQVISWARSPYYGVRDEIGSVEDAIVRVLGFDLVINLALGLALGRTLTVPKDGPNGYSPFWQQSIVMASLCSELARATTNPDKPNPGLSYLCGLLHNFGFLVLGHVFPPQFSLASRHIEANPHINRMHIEHHLLGLTREQISSCLLQQWRLPEALTIAVRQQHNPDYNGQHANYARLVFVASRMLRRHGFGDGPREAIPATMLHWLGLTAEGVEDITRRVLENIVNLRGLANILNRQ